jgi:Flp pilus assembly pilin Flp
MRSFIASLLGERAGTAAITWTFLATLVAVATIVGLSGIDPLQPINHHQTPKTSR